MGRGLRRLAWWLDWPPCLLFGAAVGNWVFAQDGFPWMVVLFVCVPVCGVLAYVTDRWARLLRGAADVCDAADELCEQIDRRDALLLERTRRDMGH